METLLKESPLSGEHQALGARMVPFAGWQMPLQYDGIIPEYHQTRTAVSVFDTSHMGEFFLAGPGAIDTLNLLVTQSLDDLPVKSCRYGVMLNDRGGIIDDLIVYRLGRDRWMVVVNAGTAEGDARQVRAHLRPGTDFDDASSRLGKLDIQGPRSREVLRTVVAGIEKLDYYTFDEFAVLGQNVIVSRTGYTGELGYEIYFPWERLPELWRECLRLGVRPAGLGVRDVLRLEMGYSLYGHELSDAVTPLDSGLSRFIDWDKPFIGKAALLEQRQGGDEQQVVCIVSDNRRSPRQGHELFTVDGDRVGQVTSGTFSPGLNRGIGLARVRKGKLSVGDKVCFGQDDLKISGEIVKRPIYRNGSLKD